jgi:hypothetical protein
MYRLSTNFDINFEINIFTVHALQLRYETYIKMCIESKRLFSLFYMLITRWQLGSQVIKMEGYRKGAMYCGLKQRNR